jgi:hypothetical protein
MNGGAIFHSSFQSLSTEKSRGSARTIYIRALREIEGENW